MYGVRHKVVETTTLEQENGGRANEFTGESKMIFVHLRQRSELTLAIAEDIGFRRCGFLEGEVPI